MASRALGLSLVVGLSACGASESNGDAGFVANCSKTEAIQTATSQSGTYTFYVCDAATPVVGFNSFSYFVVDQNGKPQDGLSLSVLPWMPYMDHGSPGTPTVTASGAGQYQVANVVFQMAGEWELRTAISAPTSDSATPQFNID